MTGSNFEGDKDRKDYNFRILSQIIQCMENGNKLIMQNLEQVYGSLYELFNQNFNIVRDKKNVRIALENMNNPMCSVHNDFHCILLLDERKIPFSDPPFLNRFEKQILTFDAVIDSHQLRGLSSSLKWWVESLMQIKPTQQKKFYEDKSVMMNPGKNNHRQFGGNQGGQGQGGQNNDIKWEKVGLEIDDIFLGFNEETFDSLVLNYSQYSQSMF